ARRHDDKQHQASCSLCHGLSGLADPSGWSRSLNAPSIQRVHSRSATTERFEKRGTNWDGASSEDAGEHPSSGSKKSRGTSWDNAPVKDTRDQKFYGPTGSRKRGTNWDNAPAEDTSLQDPYGTGVVGRKKRGTAWDNLLGGDKSKASGQNGNGWEQGRRLKRSPVTTIESRADGKDGSQKTSENQVRVKRTEDSRGNIATDSGKPTPLGAELKPAGACSSCMVKRWVSGPYVSHSSWFVPMVKDPTPGNDKRRVTRTEDSKGSVDSDGGKASSDRGVPMPLCFSCWWRQVKRCLAGAKESGWNACGA
ncbi:MAG: hypothetical protein Q9198_000104, partial [Flavoplaca austrocitrina]